MEQRHEIVGSKKEGGAGRRKEGRKEGKNEDR